MNDPCPIKIYANDRDSVIGEKCIQRYNWFKEHPDAEEEYLKDWCDQKQVPNKFLRRIDELK